MTDIKELFIKNYKLSGTWFYQLSILVCSSEDELPIIDYTNYIWELSNINGPYNETFEPKAINFQETNTGLINIENLTIPFKSMFIQEANDGTNWFDICFYTSTVEQVLGLKRDSLKKTPSQPKVLVSFFEKTLKDLNKIFPFQLAIVGIEVGGLYDLDYFKIPVKERMHELFYTRKEEMKAIHPDNKKYFGVI